VYRVLLGSSAGVGQKSIHAVMVWRYKLFFSVNEAVSALDPGFNAEPCEHDVGELLIGILRPFVVDDLSDPSI